MTKTPHLSKLTKLVFYWLPPIIWMLVIFLFSSNPAQQASEIYWEDFAVKKFAHMVEYAILATLLYRGFRGMGVNRISSIIYSFAISIFYGASDEFHQSFTPGREPRARDVIFDTIGASISLYFIWKLLPKMPKKLRILVESLGLH